MNLNLVISFLIGGLLLLAILSLNGRVIQNSGQTVVSLSTKRTVSSVNEIMQRDFLRIGYHCTHTIITATSTKIRFCADIDNDGDDTDSKQIIWHWQKHSSNLFTATENPNDYVLTRSVNNTVTGRFPVTDLTFKYYNTSGNQTTDKSKIRAIAISLETQSAVHIGNSDYAKSFLKKTFTPPTLNLAAIE